MPVAYDFGFQLSAIGTGKNRGHCECDLWKHTLIFALTALKRSHAAFQLLMYVPIDSLSSGFS